MLIYLFSPLSRQFRLIKALSIKRSFVKVNFTEFRSTPSYPHHSPLYWPEKLALGFASTIGIAVNPRRADLLACLSEVTAGPALVALRDSMLKNFVGRKLLRDKPRISSRTINLPELRCFPHDTVGRVYVDWLDKYNMSPDARDPVRYLDYDPGDPLSPPPSTLIERLEVALSLIKRQFSIELNTTLPSNLNDRVTEAAIANAAEAKHNRISEFAYVLQRYRESHDLYHAILGIPPYFEGELALKAFEYAATNMFMPALSMLAYFSLNAAQRKRFLYTYLPWALTNGRKVRPLFMCVDWENQMSTRVKDLLAYLQIHPPPNLRTLRSSAT